MEVLEIYVITLLCGEAIDKGISVASVFWDRSHGT